MRSLSSNPSSSKANQSQYILAVLTITKDLIETTNVRKKVLIVRICYSTIDVDPEMVDTIPELVSIPVSSG